MSAAPTSTGSGGEPLSVLRRRNLMLLLQEFSDQLFASGGDVNRLNVLFSEKLSIHPSLLSQIKSSRNISDKLARQIEGKCLKPSGFLDQVHETDVSSEAEQAFLALAKRVYRAASASGRRELRRLLEGMDAPAGDQRRHESPN